MISWELKEVSTTVHGNALHHKTISLTSTSKNIGAISAFNLHLIRLVHSTRTKQLPMVF